MKIDKLLENPWDNVYWFARMLINSDKYGGIGADSKTMLSVSSAIYSILDKNEQYDSDDEMIRLLNQTIRNVILHERRQGTGKYKALINLCDDLESKIETIKDFKVFALTCDKILVPINESLKQIPDNDSVFVESVAKAILETKGIDGLANLINILDDIGSKGCLTAERKTVVQSFGNLRKEISTYLDDEDLDIVLTAFCQEFERRVGQKRKGRAGRGVEGTTSLILDYFGIKATHAPEHFTTGLEIDKWIKTKDSWLIGISCKRTLRERWKQAYTTDVNLLNRHKIRELWHVVTYDKDLSDDKLTEIGSHRAILYLPDTSPRLKNALKHPGMKAYVRHMSNFISDLKKLL